MNFSPNRVLLGLIVIALSCLLWIAGHFGVDTFDSFETFLTARAIAGDPAGLYYPTRGFILALLLSPLFLVASLTAGDPASVAFTASHFVSWLMTAATTFAVYRLFRLHLDRTASLLGAALLLFNPLIIHFTPFTKEDIPGLLFTTCAFYFYHRSRTAGSVTNYILTVLFIAFAAGCRYNLLPALPLVIAAHEALSGKSQASPRGSLFRTAVLCSASVLAWLLIATTIYAFVAADSPAKATGVFLSEYYDMTVNHVGSASGESRWDSDNLRFLMRSFSPPIIAVALLGIVSCWRQRRSGALFHGVWLGLFLVIQTVVVSHRQARYLFPLFPPLYFFVVQGFAELGSSLRSRMLRHAVVAAALAWPLYNSVTEFVKFSDPFYTTHFEREVSRHARSLAGDNEVLWLGPYYTLRPRDYRFDDRDNVAYICHYSAHVVHYYTGKPIRSDTRALRLNVPGGAIANGVFPPPEVAATLRDGDSLIINPEPVAWITSSVPATIQPLVVERARTIEFFPTPATAEQTTPRFVPSAISGASLALSRDGSDVVVTAQTLPPGAYCVCLELPRGVRCSGDLLETRPGASAVRVSGGALASDTVVGKVTLLYFDSVTSFATPGARPPGRLAD